MGILNQLEGNSEEYKSLSKEAFEQAIIDLSLLPSRGVTGKSLTIFTGIRGMKEFDFSMFILALGIKGSLDVKKIYDGPPRSRNKSYDILNSKQPKSLGFRYFHLQTKSGLYKLKIYQNKKFPLHLYKGTELISQSDNFEDINKYF